MNHLTHVTYVVPDTGQALAFLESVLGFTVQDDAITITGDRFLTVSPADHSFALQVVESADYVSSKAALGIVEYIVQTADLDATVNRARAQDLVITREPVNAPYGKTAIIQDPFGNLWDLIQRPG